MKLWPVYRVPDTRPLHCPSWTPMLSMVQYLDKIGFTVYKWLWSSFLELMPSLGFIFNTQCGLGNLHGGGRLVLVPSLLAIGAAGWSEAGVRHCSHSEVMVPWSVLVVALVMSPGISVKSLSSTPFTSSLFKLSLLIFFATSCNLSIQNWNFLS